MIQGVLDRVPELFAIGRVISIQAFEVIKVSIHFILEF